MVGQHGRPRVPLTEVPSRFEPLIAQRVRVLVGRLVSRRSCAARE